MTKPVLIVTHPKDWEISEYRKESIFDIHYVSLGGYHPHKLNGVLTNDGYAEEVTVEGLDHMEKAFRKYRPNVFLFWLHSGFSYNHLDHLRSICPNVRVVFWFGNHRVKVNNAVKGFRPNLVLLNSKDTNQFSMYREHGYKVGCLYDGFNPDETPLVEKEPTFDCFFGGESYIFAALKHSGLNFPGAHIRYEFITNVNQKFKTLVTSARKDSWPFKVQPACFHPLYTERMREAKITLNLNHFPSFEKAYTRRTIRSLFARRCHITLYIPGMEDDFENKKHLVWFKTVEEGLDLITYYLKHDDEREAIANAGYKIACEKYTFKNRLVDFEVLAKKYLLRGNEND
jgi:hypothetical protein